MSETENNDLRACLRQLSSEDRMEIVNDELTQSEKDELASDWNADFIEDVRRRLREIMDLVK